MHPKPQSANLVGMSTLPSSSASNREQQGRQDATENERKSEQELQNRIRHGLLQGIDSMLNLKNVRGHTLVTLRAPLLWGPFRYHDNVNRTFRATILGDTEKKHLRVSKLKIKQLPYFFTFFSVLNPSACSQP
jgi:hypothetical protein